MLRRGVTANTTGASGIKGEGETRPRKTDKPLRILVVEDNRDAADSLRLLLEFSGYEVAVAYAGHDGVQAAEQYQPDVVLCDIGLPGLDGYGVARKIRANPTTAKARLIAVTAYGQDEDRRRSHEAGFEQHLVKPVDPDALQRVLNVPGRPETRGSHEATLTRKAKKMPDRNGEEIVRLVTASSPQEAHLRRQALEDQGIRCRVVGEYLGGFGVVYPEHPVPELWVHRDDARRAQAVLEELQEARPR
jgi:CheY-like chemotaxis protein